MSYYGEHVPDPYPGGEPDEVDLMGLEVQQVMRTRPLGDITERPYDALRADLRAHTAHAVSHSGSAALRDALVRVAAMAAVFALEIDRREMADRNLTWDEQRSMRVSVTDLVGPVVNLKLPEDAGAAAALLRRLGEER